MPSPLRYLHLDVFAASFGGGNHLGVVHGAEEWSDQRMQAFARWNNLVETTFLLPPTQPEASYRVRIFTPDKEIPFAGHPSVGSAHAALHWGLCQPVDGRLVQEGAAGLLPMLVEGDGADRQLLLRAPAAQQLPAQAEHQALLATALRGVALGELPAARVDGGRCWWVVECASEAALRGWQPDHAAIAALGKATASMGICAWARAVEQPYQLAVRAFAAAAGINEDPASGAANGLLAAYLQQVEPDGPLATGYRVSQGREIGHDAQLQVRYHDGGIWVGGRTHIVIEGQLQWPGAA